jgi:AraC-like DNA-binding protein
MPDPRFQLAGTIRRFLPNDGWKETPVPGVYCLKLSQPKPRAKNRWMACLGILAQGYKEIILGGRRYRLDEGGYSITPIELPLISGIPNPTPAKPFLALLIALDPAIVGEVSAELNGFREDEEELPQRAFFSGRASEAMLEAAVRLGNLFERPEDAPVLGRLVIRELIYHVLKSKDGPAIRRFFRLGSKLHRIMHCIHGMRSELSEDVDVAELARTACMSRSAFFEQFKEVTSMSPIQYQKRLRLLEAKRLMTEAGETAEGAAFQVGYKSASQFSREYARMFGAPPRRDASRGRGVLVG